MNSLNSCMGWRSIEKAGCDGVERRYQKIFILVIPLLLGGRESSHVGKSIWKRGKSI